MTDPDRAVFVAKVREAIETSLYTLAFVLLDGEEAATNFVNSIDTTALAEAAITAMVEHMGPEF